MEPWTQKASRSLIATITTGAALATILVHTRTLGFMRDPRELVVHPYDIHWNGAAFAILAPAVVPFLAESGLLGPCSERTAASDGQH